ncbi:uncharacterized protein LOC111035959 [Myzus persicae]|uniref:uncharacterized protein LOC111035959 n=1 Tax=Myzus persicae TaxID=13164 RepID=UPI000B93769A|nr:uncharacterized protein LOC111035959 [Myzus persicae]
MWQSLNNICLEMTGIEINVINFHADFEKAAHNAVLQIFPRCKIFDCTFHLGQNWFRQIQQNKILLSEYLKDSEIGRWMKYFYGLSYLPPNEVSDGFTDLMAVAPGTAVSSLFSDYILENYIDSNSNFLPILWACEPNGNPKTTNNAEIFHKHYNSQFYTPHPHIHQVIDILIQIQIQIQIEN